MQAAANSLESVLAVHHPSPRFPDTQCVCGGRLDNCSAIRLAREQAGIVEPGRGSRRRGPQRTR